MVLLFTRLSWVADGLSHGPRFDVVLAPMGVLDRVIVSVVLSPFVQLRPVRDADGVSHGSPWFILVEVVLFPMGVPVGGIDQVVFPPVLLCPIQDADGVSHGSSFLLVDGVVGIAPAG